MQITFNNFKSSNTKYKYLCNKLKSYAKEKELNYNFDILFGSVTITIKLIDKSILTTLIIGNKQVTFEFIQ